MGIVQQAVSEKADLNAIYDGYTTLRLALQKDDAPTALALIEGGADVNRSIPLIACAGMRDAAAAVRIARLLISRGANVNAEEESGETALHAAKKRKLDELVTLLVEAGAKE
jgi:ankyrin repeat protein